MECSKRLYKKYMGSEENISKKSTEIGMSEVPLSGEFLIFSEMVILVEDTLNPVSLSKD